MKFKSVLLFGAALAAFSGTAFTGTGAMAQSVAGQASAAANETQATGLEDVIVTARRRSESLQDVPVAVSAISKEELQNNLVADLTKIGELAPQVVIGRATIGTGAVIGVRGISSSSNDPGLDQSVAVAIDGIVLSRGRIISTAVFDLAQVEVLEGPQALFFGKNSPAGVISMSSANPTSSFQGQVRAGYEFEARERFAEAFVSGPLTDTLGARFAFRASEMDGWTKNIATPIEDPLHPGVIVPGATSGGRQPGNQEYAGRLTLVWTPTDDFEADFRLLFSHQDLNAYNAFTEAFCTNGVTQPTLFGTIIDPNADCRKDRRKSEGSLAPEFAANYTGGNNGVPYFTSEGVLAALTMTKQFGDVSVTSTTGYYEQEFSGANNADYTSFALLWGSQSETYKLFTQEFRLNTDFAGPVNFSAGVYYETSDRLFGNYPDIMHAGLNVAANNYTSFETFADAETETMSAFGQVRWQFTPTLELAAGARYSRDEKTQDAWNRTVGVTTSPLRPAGSVLTSEFSDENVSPEATLSWKFAPGHLAYLGYKTGYKAGAISNGALLLASSTADDLVIDSEVADGFEVGYKGDLFDRTLRLNLTAYSYDFDDLQLGTFNATTISFTIQNAAAARTQGVSASFDWLAADRLTVSGNLGYNRARYTRFMDAPCYAGQTVAAGCVDRRQDLTGEQLVRAPDLNATLAANYVAPLWTGWEADFSASASYSSEYQTASDNDPGGMQDGFVRLNAAVNIGPEDGRFQISVIGRNLTDEYYLASTSARPLGGPNEYIGVFNRPREVVVQVRYQF